MKNICTVLTLALLSVNGFAATGAEVCAAFSANSPKTGNPHCSFAPQVACATTITSMGQQDANGLDVCLELATYKEGETGDCGAALDCINTVGKHTFTAQSVHLCLQLASSSQDEKAVQCLKDAANTN